MGRKPRVVLYCAVMITSIMVMMPSQGTALASERVQQPISFAVGSAFSPTSYGGDHNGAYFWKAGAYANITSHWTAVLCVMHGHYTDYPAGIGRAYFTPIAMGGRFTPIALRVRPFVELLVVAVPAKWAEADRLVDGFQLGAGLSAPIVGHVGLEAAIHKLRTGGSNALNFDASPTELRGLNQILLGMSVTLDL